MSVLAPLTSVSPTLSHRSPRVRVSPVPDPTAGIWVCAGTRSLERGLVATQVSTRGGAWFNGAGPETGRAEPELS